MLYRAKNSLFPSYALPRLRRMRGNKWSKLVKSIERLPEEHPEHMAFTLMMRRLRGSLNQAEALCMMPGCANCAREVLEQYQGSERRLLAEYKNTLKEVQSFLGTLEVQVAMVA